MMRSLLFRVIKPMAESFRALGTLILLGLPLMATSALNTERVPFGVTLQVLFENAKFGAQPIHGYRVVTKFSSDRLLTEFEDLWRADPSARVWRSDMPRMKILSRVARFPEIDVLQVGQDAQGRTQATLSRGVPDAPETVGPSVCPTDWLPPHSRVLQTFTSRDSDRTSCLVLAKSTAPLNDCQAWIVAQAKRDGYRENPGLRLSSGHPSSGVVMLTNQRHDAILTLNVNGNGTELVLQKSLARP
jgi:hypothetical protein